MTDRIIDPFKVRKSARKPTKIKSHSETLQERKLRLQLELDQIEALEKNDNLGESVDRVVDLLFVMEQAKSAYAEMDELVEKLLETGETTFESSGGETIELVDNFDGKNKCWKSVCFQRFSAKLV
ncbi:hypothetical protein N8Z24_00770 [bacterium]|nr:hypothetical protein [bacterium]